MPAFGNPTSPISANNFNLKKTSASCPFPPGVVFLGALFVEDLKLIFPKPPLPPGNNKNLSVEITSAISSSSIKISVPRGSLSITS